MDNKKLTIYVLLVASLVNFLTAFLSSATTVAIPAIAVDLGLSNIVQNWVSTIFLLTIAVFSVPCGHIVGKYGIKRSMIIGVVIALVSFIGCIFSNSAELLLFFRVVQGIGCALLNVSATLFVVEPLPKEKRGRGLGISITAVYIGLTLAPLLGGLLTYNFGWQSIFAIVIPFFILALLILLFAIKKEWKINENSYFDLKGSIVYSFGIVFFIYGFTTLNSLSGIILTIIGIILLVIFVLLELKVESPVFKVRLFKGLEFSAASFASLVTYIATFVITFVLNYHFQYIWGMDSQLSGMILIITPVLQAVFSPVSGRLSDRMNPLKISAFGLVFVTLALGILCTLNESTSMILIVFAMVLQGIGWGLFSSPNVNAIMSSVPKEDTNQASAAVSTIRTVGQTLSVGIFTMVFAVIMGNVAIVPGNYNLLMASSRISCIISTILCLLALFACILGYKKGTVLKH